MSVASNYSGSVNPGPPARGQPNSKLQLDLYARTAAYRADANLRGKRDIIRPLSRMQVDNEQRCRREQARLGAEQPAIGAPVECPRPLIQELRVAPQIAAVRSQRAGVLRRAADGE